MTLVCHSPNKSMELVSPATRIHSFLPMGCYDYDLCRLQGILNSLRHIFTCTSRYSHLIDLHWLPVCQHIDFKWCLLQTGLPPYFHSDLTPYSCILNPRRSNPSNNYLTMLAFDHKLHKSKRFFDSSFSVSLRTPSPFYPSFRIYFNLLTLVVSKTLFMRREPVLLYRYSHSIMST